VNVTNEELRQIMTAWAGYEVDIVTIQELAELFFE